VRISLSLLAYSKNELKEYRSVSKSDIDNREHDGGDKKRHNKRLNHELLTDKYLVSKQIYSYFPLRQIVYCKIVRGEYSHNFTEGSVIKHHRPDKVSSCQETIEILALQIIQ